MRELKFRAWSEETKSFEYFDLYEGTECGLTNLQIWARNNQIEQYTGLKDKNGKEIYDGDIIRNTIPVATNKSSTYQVFYKVDFATFEVAPIDGKIDILSGGFNFASMTHYEVIGNIHENKELKEGK